MYATCLDLYILGDFFDMPELRSEALSYLTTHCNNKAGTLQQRQPQGEALKQILDLDALFEGLKLAFGENADEGNPVACVLLAFVHKTRFCLLHNQRFKELLGQVPRFAVAMMRALYGGSSNSNGNLETNGDSGGNIYGNFSDQNDLKGARYPSHCVACGTPPGNGKCFDKIYPFTGQAWEPCAYCSACAPTADVRNGVKLKRRFPTYNFPEF